jgi:proline iminopeptidase
VLRQSNWQAGTPPPWWSRQGCSVGQRRFFDPSLYNTVLFDQRGAGRSRPLASDPDTDLSGNTTQHLIADIEALRELRHVDRWTILGVSWGCTLGLPTPRLTPHRINALVLAFVTTTSRREVQWITEDVGRLFPQQWERFIDAIPHQLRYLRPVEAYARMLADPDPIARDLAAQEWCAWEDAHVSLTPGHSPNPRYQDSEFRLRFARLITHYWQDAAFLEEDQLIRDAATLNGVPGVLIHGRFDIVDH